MSTRDVLLLAALCCACAASKPPPPVHDPGAGDCAAACANLERLGCQGAKGSPGRDDVPGTADDVPCSVACEDVEREGVSSLATGCVAGAASCSAADACLAEATP